MEVRIIEDKPRFYIVLENYNDADKKKALDLVSNLFGISEKTEVPEGLKQVKVEDTRPTENAKDVTEEVMKPGPVADAEPVKPEPVKKPEKPSDPNAVGPITSTKEFINEFKKSTGYSADQKNKWKRISRNYMRKIYITDTDREKMSDFICEFQSLFEDVLKGLKDMKAETDPTALRDYLNGLNPDEVKSVYTKCRTVIDQAIK